MDKIYSAQASQDFDEYYEDFHEAMRVSEVSLARQHLRRSPQLQSRDKLIEFTRTLCTERLLARTTLHLACYLIDSFMDLFEIAQERLRMFCAVCVLIAAKLEDISLCIPRWNELQPFFEAPIEAREYAVLECMIVNAMQWKINVPTAASFLEYYIVGSITIRDVPIRLRSNRSKERPQSFPELRLKMYNLVYYLLDLSLNDLGMIGVRPSKLAAAAVLCARQIAGYYIPWTVELQHLTEYEMQDICSVAKELRRLYGADNLDVMPLLDGRKRLYPFEGETTLEVDFLPKRMRD